MSIKNTCSAFFAAAASVLLCSTSLAADEPALSATDVDVSFADIVFIVTDPQLDFPSQAGVAWGVLANDATHRLGCGAVTGNGVPAGCQLT